MFIRIVKLIDRMAKVIDRRWKVIVRGIARRENTNWSSACGATGRKVVIRWRVPRSIGRPGNKHLAQKAFDK